MDDPLSVKKFQALQQRVGKPADEGNTETLEVVLLDELIQVDPARNKGKKTLA